MCQSPSKSKIIFNVPESEVDIVDADVKPDTAVKVELARFEQEKAAIVEMIANGAKLAHRWNGNACRTNEEAER